MNVKQVEQFGEFITLIEAARRKGSTSTAIYQYLKNRHIPVVKCGQTILVRPEQIVGYERTWIKAR